MLNSNICQEKRICPRCKSAESLIPDDICNDRFLQWVCVAEDCSYIEVTELPPLKKEIIYLDQNIISEMVKSRIEGKRDFFMDLFDKIQESTIKEEIICPYSEHHKLESDLSGDRNYAMSLLKLIRKLSYGIRFRGCSEIEDKQILASILRYCGKDQPTEHVSDWQEAFCSNPHAYLPLVGRIEVYQWIDDMIQHQKEVKNGYQQGMQKVHDVWVMQSGSFDESLLAEKKAYADFIVQSAFLSLPEKYDFWNDMTIMELRQKPLSIQRMLARYISDARSDFNIVADFLYSDSFYDTPYIHIQASISAALASEMRKPKPKNRRPWKVEPSDMLDIQILSHYLPYCNAMFIDNRFRRILSKILRFDQKYSVKLFSMKNKEDFLGFVESFL